MATSNIFVFYIIIVPNSALPCSVCLTAELGPDLTRDLRLFSVRGLNGATILLRHFYFQSKCCCMESKRQYNVRKIFIFIWWMSVKAFTINVSVDNNNNIDNLCI